MRAKLGLEDDGARCGGVLLLQGADGKCRDDTDHEILFRQESNFAYLFGVKEAGPGVYGTIDLDTGKTTLYFPCLPAEYAVWMGAVRTLESFKKEYGVDATSFSDNLCEDLKALGPSVLYTTRGYNSDSHAYAKEATFDGIKQFRVDNGVLYDAIVECRVIKTEHELELMRHINRISSEAHMWVMAHAEPNMREFQLESMFQHWGYWGGCRHCSYTRYAAAEKRIGSSLGPRGRAKWKVVKDGDMCLLDMGGEFRCYASDITCSYPVNGVLRTIRELSMRLCLLYSGPLWIR